MTAFTFLLVFDKLSFIRPYERGYFCNDESVWYPIVEESIGDTEIILMAFLIFPAVVSTMDIHVCNYKY